MTHMTTHKQKRLVLVASDKGGTGKSTTSKLVWERMRVLNPNARAFDADGTTGSFVSVYGAYDNDDNLITPQPSSGVTPIMLHGNDRDRDRTLVAAIETDADLVLVDLPATSLTVLERIESEWGFLSDAGRSGYKITFVNVVSPYTSSLANVLKTFTLAPNADYVVVLNEVFGEQDDYLLWYGDETYGMPQSQGKAMLAQRGGVEIILPKVASRPLVLADMWNLTFEQAVEDKRIERPDRNRLRRWLEDAYAAMSPADHLLGLSQPEPTKGKHKTEALVGAAS